MDIAGGLTALSELLKPPDEIEEDSDEVKLFAVYLFWFIAKNAVNNFA